MPPVPELDRLASVDYALALDRLGGDADLYREIGRLFLSEAPERMQALERARAAADADGIQRAAHALRGSLGLLGAHLAARAALQVEACGRQGDLAGAARSLPALRAALDRVQDDLRRLKSSAGLSRARPFAQPAPEPPD